MAAINELINQIEDKALRDRIADEVARMNKQKKFGLVFEEHLPECTPLWDIPVKKGAQVAKKTGKVSDIYSVLKISDGIATCIHKEDKEIEEIAVGDLVTVAEFGEPIYPYLKPIDSVCNAPDSDLWHTLIEADNYHALQLLEYLYAGKVDCIYIDPPYNTGARDWKYNNDYVDSSDSYRHSKWLSFMEKRLMIAKKLLNPKDSVLIVTIDEKEYLHLGCLLEEMFPDSNMQMISSNIHHGGSNRKGEFSRTNEFIYFLRFGKAVVLGEVNNDVSGLKWRSFARGNWVREQRPNLFFPIFVNKDGKIFEIGDSLPLEVKTSDIIPPTDCEAIFPINTRGQESIWCLSPQSARELLKQGFFKTNIKKTKNGRKITFSYLMEGAIEDMKEGRSVIDGYNEDGSVIGHYVSGNYKIPSTQWNKVEHDATQYGTHIIRNILCEDRFSFPKSLYAVKDSISYFIANKPNALVVDFFAGSGTTLHAVNLLNAEDEGHRRCIMITNNEVSDAENKALTAKGYKPGDYEWEKLGIARYITWPRTICSIEGHDIEGKPLKGNYIGSDMPMANGFNSNAMFFKLGFLDKNEVSLGKQFNELLPVLWMKAGAIGKCPELLEKKHDMLILPQNKFAVLMDEKAYMEFIEEIDKYPEIQTLYFVTDSESGYRDMIVGFEDKDTYQLYRDYLDNFRINRWRK